MVENFSRNLLNELVKWLDRKEIFAIIGPRQAGKTTLMHLLKSHLIRKGITEQNIIFLKCDDFEEAQSFEKNPKTFVRSIATKESEKYYFFFDEFHNIQDSGKILKNLYDSFPNIKFIVSSSSSLELKDKTAKYLVGRVFYFRLHPFSFNEFVESKNQKLGEILKEKNRTIVEFILNDVDLNFRDEIFLQQLSELFEDYAVFGGYPEVIKAQSSEEKKIILKNIYETYISKDILELLKITDIIKFRDIVNMLGAQHSNLLSLQLLSSDTKSYYKECKQFLSVLEETFILRILHPFHKNFVTELKKNPKTYFVDSGLRNYVVKNFNQIEFREDRGKLAEGFVLSELVNIMEFETEIKFWRTTSQAEVDFVLIKGQELIPVEVKFENFAKTRIGKSMKSFIHKYSPKKAIIVTKNYYASTNIGKTKVKFIPIAYI